MKKLDFENLRDYILQYNKCFVRGFANAFKSDTTNAIWVHDGSDLKCLLPADVYGSYFYLRNESSIKYEIKQDERLTDSGTQRVSFLDTIIIHLIAIVKDADEYKLIEDLRNAAMSFRDMSVIPVSSNWNREQILEEELSKMKPDDISAALQRLKDETIIKLTLNVSKGFIPDNCIITSQN